jgi:hypothetical protein
MPVCLSVCTACPTPLHQRLNQLMELAMLWLRRLVAGVPPRRPGFDPGSGHVGFVADKVALGQVFP